MECNPGSISQSCHNAPCDIPLSLPSRLWGAFIPMLMLHSEDLRCSTPKYSSGVHANATTRLHAMVQLQTIKCYDPWGFLRACMVECQQVVLFRLHPCLDLTVDPVQEVILLWMGRALKQGISQKTIHSAQQGGTHHC